MVEKDGKDGIERRVYNLPSDLMVRLRSFQVSQGISSEAEAARRLLDSALQMRDDVHGILKSLKAKFNEEKDLRVLAGDVLTKHSLVVTVSIEHNSVEFVLRNGDRGKMDAKGDIQFGDSDAPSDHWNSYASPSVRRAAPPKWETKTAAELDDDIPF